MSQPSCPVSSSPCSLYFSYTDFFFSNSWCPNLFCLRDFSQGILFLEQSPCICPCKLFSSFMFQLKKFVSSEKTFLLLYLMYVFQSYSFSALIILHNMCFNLQFCGPTLFSCTGARLWALWALGSDLLVQHVISGTYHVTSGTQYMLNKCLLKSNSMDGLLQRKI